MATKTKKPRGGTHFQLVEIEKTKESALYRTTDGLYEIRGVDLNCTDAVARAAGAGPVWYWCPAGTDTTDHAFALRELCWQGLDAEYERRSQAQANPPAGHIIIACACGQKNRAALDGLSLVDRDRYSRRLRCASCKREFLSTEIGGAIMSAVGLG